MIPSLRLISRIRSSWAAIGLLLLVSSAFAAPPPTAPVAPVTQPELEQALADGLKRIPEAEFIRTKARELGIRVWLFGGTAAAYAHYVKWDRLREHGDPRFQPDRFDYDYTNIFRSTQDLDLVVDGPPEAADALERALTATYPHLQGGKTAWEIRMLRTKRGDKESLLGNPEFHDQHTDSHSTGMIELTPPLPGERIVRDIRDWSSSRPAFLADVLDGKLHYYFSPKHAQTGRFKDGMNPPIFSAIRFLTKAFQYELEIRPEDRARILEIIRDFNPDRDLHHAYAKKWIEKNGKKLIQHAVNIEYAVKVLDEFGLRDRLRALGNPEQKESLAWWMSKEPLRTRPVGEGDGRTARELGVTIVAHETQSFLAYESITRAHTGDPNVLISRGGASEERAAFGNGFYTKFGRKGAIGTGLTIRFTIDPNARDGADFLYVPQEKYFVILNKAAIRVIPESLKLGALDFFEMLAAERQFDHSDLGIIEKLRRRINANFRSISKRDLARILELVRTSAERQPPRLAGITLQEPVLNEWLRLSESANHPELIEPLFLSTSSDLRDSIGKIIIYQPHWYRYLASSPTHRAVTKDFLYRTASERHNFDPLRDPKIAALPVSAVVIEELLEEGKKDGLIAHLLDRDAWRSHPKAPGWIERILDRGRAFSEVFSCPELLKATAWIDHPKMEQWITAALRDAPQGMIEDEMARHLLSREHWLNHAQAPTWVRQFLNRSTSLKGRELLIQNVLSHPRWANDSEGQAAVLRLVKESREQNHGKLGVLLIEHVLSRPEWQGWAKEYGVVSDLLVAMDGTPGSAVAEKILSRPYWAQHPRTDDLVRILFNLRKEHYIAKYLLSQEAWRNHPHASAWTKEIIRMGSGRHLPGCLNEAIRDH